MKRDHANEQAKYIAAVREYAERLMDNTSVVRHLISSNAFLSMAAKASKVDEK